MLRRIHPTQETAMEEQLSLFERVSKRWVERVWESAGAERREAAISVLAQMAAATVERLRAAPQQEMDDES